MSPICMYICEEGGFKGVYLDIWKKNVRKILEKGKKKKKQKKEKERKQKLH